MRCGYDLEVLSKFGVKVSVNIDPGTHCHALITGSSGSGKSQTLLYLIGSLLRSDPETVIFLCDFKNSNDFGFLSSYKYYYQGIDCYRGVMEYYAHFNQARKEGAWERCILLIDEYPAFITYLEAMDKADKTHQAKDILSAISEILMMGRGLKFGLWVITQRSDSAWFPSGSRDNFMLTIALGRLSREQAKMLFSGEDIPDRIYKPGQGLLLADGQALREVAFPMIRDARDWKRHILLALSRNSSISKPDWGPD